MQGIQQTSFVVTPPMPELPDRERPINRLREVGAYGVSNTELLALVLRQADLEMAQQLLGKFQNLSSLANANESELTGVPGVGPQTAAALQAALELGRRLMNEALPDKRQIRSPSDAASILLPMLSHREQENFVVLYLNTRNCVTSKEILYKGSLNTSVVRPAEVFRSAIRRNCAAIIVSHNHPSGNPDPSPEDVALTRRLIEAGELLQVELLDHVVIGNTSYMSMRERNLAFGADQSPQKVTLSHNATIAEPVAVNSSNRKGA